VNGELSSGVRSTLGSRKTETTTRRRYCIQNESVTSDAARQSRQNVIHFVTFTIYPILILLVGEVSRWTIAVWRF